MSVCGIVLAGGLGTRLMPTTSIISKHLLPVYNKPMIFYSLSLLIYAGIKNILIIVDPAQLKNFKKIINVNKFKRQKINIDFNIQDNPQGGIAEALMLGKKFSQRFNKICLILGDNFFYGREMPKILNKACKAKDAKAKVFLCPVNNPEQYGVANINNKGKIISLIEKPKNPKSNLAVTGLYVYSSNIFNLIKKIKRSKRGELEITSLNKLLLKNNSLECQHLGRGITWFDLGTYENIMICAEFIKLIEKRVGYKLADII